MSILHLTIPIALFFITSISIWLTYSSSQHYSTTSDDYEIPAYKRRLNIEQQKSLQAKLEGIEPRTVQF